MLSCPALVAEPVKASKPVVEGAKAALVPEAAPVTTGGTAVVAAGAGGGVPAMRPTDESDVVKPTWGTTTEVLMTLVVVQLDAAPA